MIEYLEPVWFKDAPKSKICAYTNRNSRWSNKTKPSLRSIAP